MNYATKQDNPSDGSAGRREPTPRDIGELRLIASDLFPGSKRSLDALNAGLLRAWNQTNPVSWILAHVRCELFQLAPHAYADRMDGLSVSTLSHLERHRDFTSARYNPATISSLISAWNGLVQSPEFEHLRESVDVATSKLLEVLTCDSESALYRLLSRWRYRFGPDKFDASTGLNYKQLWARGNAGVVSSFQTILEYGQALGAIPSTRNLVELRDNSFFQEAELAWKEDSVRLGRTPSVLDLHVILDSAGIELDQKELCSLGITIPLRTMEALKSFNLVSWTKVKPFCEYIKKSHIIPENELVQLRKTWQRDWRARSQSFEEILWQKLRASHLDTRRIADAVGITTKDVHKPSTTVFKALKYGERSKWISPGVLAHMIVVDDVEREALLDQKRNEIAEARKRRGSSVVSPVAIERAVWSLRYSDLPFPKKDIQSLEWGAHNDLDEREIVSRIRAIGEARAREPVARLRSRDVNDTICSMFDNLIFKNGIAKTARILNSSQGLIQCYRDGEEVPSLPRLREFAQRVNVSISEELVGDWYEKIASHGTMEVSTPLGRILHGHILENADSRRDLLNRSYRTINIGRYLLGIAETGQVKKRDLSKIFKSYGINPAGERARYIRAVIQTGSMIDGVRLWLKGTKSEMAQSLQSNAEAKSDDSDSRPQQSSHREESINVVLRELVGLTRRELEVALRGGSDPVRQLQRTFLKKIAKRGINEIQLMYGCVGCCALDRVPIDLIKQSLVRAAHTPVMPLGIAASLAHPKGASRGNALKECRKAVSFLLSNEGVPESPVSVEQRLWGIGASELSVGKKVHQKAVWSGEESLGSDTLHEIIAARDKKLGTVFERIQFAVQSRSSKSLLRIATEASQGQERAVREALGLSFRQPGEVARGEFLLSLQQYLTLGAMAGVLDARFLEFCWTLEVADSEQLSTVPPLERSLYIHLLGQHRTDVSAEGKKNSRDFEMAREFTKRCGLTVGRYRKMLTLAQAQRELVVKEWKHILNELQAGNQKYLVELLSECVKHNSMQSAVGRWLWAHREDEALLDSWRSLVKSLSAFQQQSLVSHEGDFDLEIPPSDVGSAGEAIQLVRLFRGVSSAELLKIAELFQKSLDLEEAQAKKALRQSSDAGVWYPDTEVLSASYSTRLQALVGRLLDSYRVDFKGLTSLFPECARGLGCLEKVLGEELQWYVASLAMYREPLDAFGLMVEVVQGGKVPKHSGAKHFAFHQRWLHERGALGKLNAHSIKLYFAEPFVMPSK